MIDISDNRKMIVLTATAIGVGVIIVALAVVVGNPSPLGVLGVILVSGVFFVLAYVFHSGKYENWENRISWTIIILIVIVRPDTLTIFLIIFLLFEIQKKQNAAKMSESVESTVSTTIPARK